MNSITVFFIVVGILGLVVNTLIFALGVLKWYGKKPAAVRKFFEEKRQDLAWKIYLFIACILSLFIGFVFVSLIRLPVFQIEVVIIDVMMLWALLGIWTPAIQRLRNKRINNAADITNICLAVLILVSFWITQWPAWLIPTLVTSLLILLFVFYMVDRFIVKRKRHATDSS